MGRLEAYEPVTTSCLARFLPPSCPRTLTSARKSLTPDLNGTLVRPTCTLVHPSQLSPIPNANTSPPTKNSIPHSNGGIARPGSRSRPAFLYAFLPCLPLPTVCAWLDAMMRSSALLRGMVGKRFEAERVRVGRGHVGGDLVGALARDTLGLTRREYSKFSYRYFSLSSFSSCVLLFGLRGLDRLVI